MEPGMNRDFVEMLSALSETGAEFLIVGAHAVAAHGHPRATGDLDIWVRPSSENAERVYQALQVFGAPLTNSFPGRPFSFRYRVSDWCLAVSYRSTYVHHGSRFFSSLAE